MATDVIDEGRFAGHRVEVECRDVVSVSVRGDTRVDLSEFILTA